MAKKNRFERHCTCCGKAYEFCPNCSDFDRLPRWMDAYCSENCKDLYNICAGYVNGWMEPDVEAARLVKMDLSYADKLSTWMQDAIKAMQSIDVQYADAINEVLEDTEKEIPNDNVNELDKSDENHKSNVATDSAKKNNVQKKYKPNKYIK